MYKKILYVDELVYMYFKAGDWNTYIYLQLRSMMFTCL
jgi:hypothetical protein